MYIKEACQTKGIRTCCCNLVVITLDCKSTTWAESMWVQTPFLKLNWCELVVAASGKYGKWCRRVRLLFLIATPVKAWANAVLTMGSPECLAVRLTVRSQWAHWYHYMVSSSVDLMNSSQQAHGMSCKLKEASQQAHSVSCKLTEGSQQAHSVSSTCEFTVRQMSGLKMSSLWVLM